MKGRFDSERHHRRSIRLPGYDYRNPGAYFVTVCTHQRACLFGEVIDWEFQASAEGKLVDRCWRAIPDHCPGVELDAWVVMPNHVHGIIVIRDDRVVARNDVPVPGVGGDDGPFGAIVDGDRAAYGGARDGDRAGHGAARDGQWASYVGARHAVPLQDVDGDDGLFGVIVDGDGPGYGGARDGDRAWYGAARDGQWASYVGARHAVPLHHTIHESFGEPISGSLPTIIRSFKSAATRLVNQHRGTPSAPVWQRGYYERVIRDAKALERVRAYIASNPARWAMDGLHPNARTDDRGKA